jgi:DNA adenine methylase
MLSNFMKLLFLNNALLDGHYVEFYAGGAAIAWSLLFDEYVRHVHINDIDPAVFAFWSSVLYDTEGLSRLVRDTPISMQVWRRQRAILQQSANHSQLELGFAAFFLNRTNRSGIMRGGVIGGKAQNGPWRLDARFNRGDLIARITRIARYATRISLYNVDAAELLSRLVPTLPSRSFLYLDPPYYIKGKDLYEHHYSDADHKVISDLLATYSNRAWVVTYDAVPRILRLYRGYRQIRYDLSYSAQERYLGSEVMFLSNAISKPGVSNPARVSSSYMQHASRVLANQYMPTV